MSNNILSIVSKLIKISTLNSKNEIEEFENIIDMLSKKETSMMFSLIVYGLNDESMHPEVTFGILHIIERADTNDYIRNVIDKTDFFISHCPGWYKVILYRIFNVKEYYELFVEEIKKNRIHDRNAFVKLIKSIISESPKFLKECNLILNALDES